MPKGTRAHARFAKRAEVQLTWTDGGSDKFTSGICLDVSQGGMKISVPDPVPLQTYVTVFSRKLNVRGTGSVRHCRRVKMKFEIGLEFTGGLQWQDETATA